MINSITNKLSLIKKIQDNNHLQNFRSYLNFKIQQKNFNSYSPDQNGKKYLMIMACHCTSQLKFDTIKKNLRYFAFTNCDKILINSENTKFKDGLQELCNKYTNAKYIEITK